MLGLHTTNTATFPWLNSSFAGLGVAQMGAWQLATRGTLSFEQTPTHTLLGLAPTQAIQPTLLRRDPDSHFSKAPQRSFLSTGSQAAGTELRRRHVLTLGPQQRPLGTSVTTLKKPVLGTSHLLLDETVQHLLRVAGQRGPKEDRALSHVSLRAFAETDSGTTGSAGPLPTTSNQVAPDLELPNLKLLELTETRLPAVTRTPQASASPQTGAAPANVMVSPPVSVAVMTSISSGIELAKSPSPLVDGLQNEPHVDVESRVATEVEVISSLLVSVANRPRLALAAFPGAPLTDGVAPLPESNHLATVQDALYTLSFSIRDMPEVLDARAMLALRPVFQNLGLLQGFRSFVQEFLVISPRSEIARVQFVDFVNDVVIARVLAQTEIQVHEGAKSLLDQTVLKGLLLGHTREPDLDASQDLGALRVQGAGDGSDANPDGGGDEQQHQYQPS